MFYINIISSNINVHKTFTECIILNNIYRNKNKYILWKLDNLNWLGAKKKFEFSKIFLTENIYFKAEAKAFLRVIKNSTYRGSTV